MLNYNLNNNNFIETNNIIYKSESFVKINDENQSDKNIAYFLVLFCMIALSIIFPNVFDGKIETEIFVISSILIAGFIIILIISKIKIKIPVIHEINNEGVISYFNGKEEHNIKWN
ncbi:MAG TPA: hypothetical protein DCP90_04130 [Clostridiales bacterium]|nr:MAG: hypothetical protein A2Y22_07365 [Clostridiales bacterium GWD2_32_59]HAN09783.1 hypothetical protein [Clostridiales bacterium]